MPKGSAQHPLNQFQDLLLLVAFVKVYPFDLYFNMVECLSFQYEMQFGLLNQYNGGFSGLTIIYTYRKTLIRSIAISKLPQIYLHILILIKHTFVKILLYLQYVHISNISESKYLLAVTLGRSFFQGSIVVWWGEGGQGW